MEALKNSFMAIPSIYENPRKNEIWLFETKAVFISIKYQHTRRLQNAFEIWNLGSHDGIQQLAVFVISLHWAQYYILGGGHMDGHRINIVQ